MALNEYREDPEGPGWVKFSLHIESDDISADTIQDAIGISPSFARNQGEAIDLSDPMSYRYESTKVIFGLINNESKSLDGQISESVSQARTIIDKLHSVREHCRIFMHVSIIDESSETYIELTLETLSELKEIGIGIDFLVSTNGD